jgi:hypothetical protein
MNDPTDPTRPDTGSEPDLDTLLAAWAADHRLHPQEAERLLTSILGPEPDPTPVAAVAPTALPATWWAQLSQQVTAAIVLAASRPAAGDVAHS